MLFWTTPYTRWIRWQNAKITTADVDAGLAGPGRRKRLQELNGCHNFWCYGPSKKRIRVALDPTRTRIITVANADSRTRK
jgi:hypothetical protein